MPFDIILNATSFVRGLVQNDSSHILAQNTSKITFERFIASDNDAELLMHPPNISPVRQRPDQLGLVDWTTLG